MPLQSQWAQPSHHGQASFLPESKIPGPARPAVAEFLALRRRKADAENRRREAAGELKAAQLADADALREHVKAGGSARTFEPTTEAAEKAVEHAEQDLGALDRLLGEQYVATVGELKEVAGEGTEAARVAVEGTAAAYRDAIAALQAARRAYLDSVGEVMFWQHLTERHAPNARLGSGDQINTRRGPITKIDGTTLHLLRADAETHQRLPGQEAAITIGDMT